MIELSHIRFSYPERVPLLKDLSLNFPAGKVTAVLGPNGCGKSTMLRIACGLQRPDDGKVLVDGCNVTSFDRKALARHCALLTQDARLPAIPVADYVAYGRYPYQRFGGRLTQTDQEAIDRALRETALAPLSASRLDHLSGGQRQMARIALLLAQDPDTLLLDEPTTYLDIAACFSMMEILRRCAVRGKAVVLVLHDLSLALRCVDRVVLLEEGKLVAVDDPKTIADGLLDEVFHVRTHVFQKDGSLYYGFSKELS